MKSINCSLDSFGYEMTPAPAVQVFYFLPRLNLGRMTTFMIDTGASGTCLHGFDAWRLQTHMRPETLDCTARGIGGNCSYYGEEAVLLFVGNDSKPIPFGLKRIDIQQITTQNLNEDSELLKVPCILGRDIINKCEFTYCALTNNVRFTLQ